MCKNMLHICTNSTIRFTLSFVNLFVEVSRVCGLCYLRSTVDRTNEGFRNGAVAVGGGRPKTRLSAKSFDKLERCRTGCQSCKNLNDKEVIFGIICNRIE